MVLLAFPEEGWFIAPAFQADAVGTIPADVDDPAGFVLQLFFRDFPGEILQSFFVRSDIGHDRSSTWIWKDGIISDSREKSKPGLRGSGIDIPRGFG
jgi:hypothetical protein